jgi:predicted component of type VI protein secretion system
MSHQSLNRFLGACRVAGPLELHAETIAPGKALRRSFDRPFAVVGRDPRCDLPLEDDQVSQRHTYFQISEGRVFVLDLGTQAGTYWPDGTRHPGWLRADEVVRIGPFHVRLEGAGAVEQVPGGDWNPLAPGSISRVGATPVLLEFLNGNGKDSRWPLDRVLTLVGRTGLCPLQLVHRSVSKTHCALLATAGGLWVIDLLGRGGVLVNGKALRWACLEDGDTLEVGEFRIAVRFPEAVDERAEEKFVNLIHGDFYLPVMSETSPRGAPSSGLPTTRGSTAPAMPFGGLPAAAPPGSPEALLMLFAQQFAYMQQQMFEQFQQSMTTMLQAFSAMHHDQMTLVRGELDQLRQLTERLNDLQVELARQPVADRNEAPTVRLPTAQAPPRRNGKSLPERAAPRAQPAAAARKPQQSAAGAAKPDVHAWLSEQIVTLQRERQSVWQRLMGTLTGKGDQPLP